MSAIASATPDTSAPVEDDGMSQWSHEEELLSESVRLHAPWEAKLSGSTICFLLVVLGVVAAHKSSSHLARSDVLPTNSKTHNC